MSTAMMWMLMREAVTDDDADSNLLEWACLEAQALQKSGGHHDKEAVNIIAERINDVKSDFNTKLIDRLFYYCEGHNAWLPLDKDISGYEQFNADLKNGEEMNVRIKRTDMTEAQFVSMPDIS